MGTPRFWRASVRRRPSAINRQIPYRWDEFTFLGLSEKNPFALVVNAKSTHQTFEDLKAAIKGGEKLSYLRTLGYQTVVCGKTYFIGPDQVHGYNERVTTEFYPSNFIRAPDWVERERYRPTGINMSAVVDAGQCVRSLQLDYDEEVEHIGMQKIHDLARFN